MKVSAPEYEEAERVLEELEGTERQARSRVASSISIDQGLELDIDDVDTFLH